MSHVDYQYIIADLVTGEVIEELNLVDVVWDKKVNSAGTCKGSVALSSTKAVKDIEPLTTPGMRAMYVIRDDEVMWGGILWDRDYESESKKLTLTALSFEVYFYHRVIWKKRAYDTPTDMFRIVRDLVKAINVDFDPTESVIDGTPNQYHPDAGYDGRPNSGSIGIELGSGTRGETETNNEDFRGSELKFVGEIIDALSQHQGKYFEYRIKSTLESELFVKRLELYVPEPDGGDTGLVFEYPGTISSYKWSDSMEHGATRYWVTGDGQGADKKIGYWINDALLDGGNGFPLYDEVELSQHGSTKNVTKLESYAERYGKKARPPIEDWEMTVYGGRDPTVNTYQPGEWAKFIIKDNEFGSTEAFTRRIVEMTVTVPNEEASHETVSLVLTNEAGDLTDLV